MKKKKITYRQDVAFINRIKELKELSNYLDKRPSEILLLHGPKSSGKTTLLYKFLEQVKTEQALEIKFLNLRETYTAMYEDFLKAFFQVEEEKEKASIKDFVQAGIGKDVVEELLRDMVSNNILYFDPTEALFYPQGKSYYQGIKIYFAQ